jgi:hypothetical protein
MPAEGAQAVINLRKYGIPLRCGAQMDLFQIC